MESQNVINFPDPEYEFLRDIEITQKLYHVWMFFSVETFWFNNGTILILFP